MHNYHYKGQVQNKEKHIKTGNLLISIPNVMSIFFSVIAIASVVSGLEAIYTRTRRSQINKQIVMELAIYLIPMYIMHVGYIYAGMEGEKQQSVSLLVINTFHAYKTDIKGN